MKKTLIITAILCFAALALGCSTTEPVDLNADDVVYGTEGKTVGDTLDKLGNSVATHNHKVVDITDLDLNKYSTIGHEHKASDITDFDTAARNAVPSKYTDTEAQTAAIKAMGAKVNTNSFNHDRYGEADLKASPTIIDIYSKVGGGTATTSPDCPPGYKDTKIPVSWIPGMSWTLCTKGSDILIKVGDFWIDRFETVINTKKDCTGTSQTSYPNPDTTLYFACSIQSTTQVPASLTYYQAQQACTNSGKHLCTNAEWQAAAAGPVNTGYNTGNKETSVKPTYSGSCSKTTGTCNMVGNAHEWVAGLVLDGVSTTGKALIRGGSYNTNGSEDYIQSAAPTTTHGARCCISGGR